MRLATILTSVYLLMGLEPPGCFTAEVQTVRLATILTSVYLLMGLGPLLAVVQLKYRQ